MAYCLKPLHREKVVLEHLQQYQNVLTYTLVTKLDTSLSLVIVGSYEAYLGHLFHLLKLQGTGHGEDTSLVEG